MTDLMAWYATAIHPLAILFGFGLPVFRALLRRIKDVAPCFDGKTAAHDFANGLVFPTFVALVLVPMHHPLQGQLDMHTLQLAGGIGIFHVIREIFSA